MKKFLFYLLILSCNVSFADDELIFTNDNEIKNEQPSVINQEASHLNEQSQKKNQTKIAAIINKRVELQQENVEQFSSPILNFIINTSRPFIEARIDQMIIQAGFIDNLHKITNLSEKLKINILKNAPINSKVLTCGQDAEISFSVQDEYGNFIKNTDEKPFWLRIGANETVRGFELGMIGAKIGEEREIIVTQDLNTGSSELSTNLLAIGKNAIFRAKLHDIRQDDIIRTLHYYDVIGSISRKITCGDQVGLDFKIFDAKGKLLYKKQNLPIFIGSGLNQYFEQILLGSHNNGQRIALIDAKYLNLEEINIEGGVALELSPRLIG